MKIEEIAPEEALQRYYSLRAPEYEKVYERDDPARQEELAELTAALEKALRRRRVLEIACGTGYWTAIASRVARHIVAIDSSPEMLAIASQKRIRRGRVEFRRADAYTLEDVPGEFDAGLANFWLSHVPRERVLSFLRAFQHRLAPGSVVFMADNQYVPGQDGELVTRPGEKDTFKRRTLSDGSQVEILKNYYDADQLHRLLKPLASDLRVDAGEIFWWVTCRL